MTKLKLNAMDAFALGIVSVGALATAAVYSRLPARIPTHFDLHGRVDGWMDRSKGAWLLPICALAIWALVRFAVQVVPVVHRASAAKPMRAVALLTAGLMTGLQILVLRAALFPAGSIAGSLTFMLGVFMISMAQLLPRTQRNAFVGIRTPWALASDENWARTHRLAGYAFTVAGLVSVVAALVAGTESTIVAFAALIAASLVPAVYSIIVARRVPPPC